MAQDSFATQARFILHILFCYALACTATSCVRLPRRTHLIITSDQIAPPSVQSDALATPRVNINTASRADLEKLPGIGQALAARIVEHRERYGPFRRAEHLIVVRGISDRRFRQMRAFVTAE